MRRPELGVFVKGRATNGFTLKEIASVGSRGLNKKDKQGGQIRVWAGSSEGGGCILNIQSPYKVWTRSPGTE